MAVSLDSALPALYVEDREFNKKEIICTPGSGPDFGGIIRSGTAVLESTDPDGVRRILHYYIAGDVFLTKGFPGAAADHFILTARSRCRVGFLSETPGKNSSAAAEIRDIEPICNAAQRHLLSHIFILGQHSLRQKILVFLREVSEGRKSFSLPLSLTDCADYLAADRSAMMRELAGLEEEGLIRHKGRQFTLLSPWPGTK